MAGEAEILKSLTEVLAVKSNDYVIAGSEFSPSWEVFNRLLVLAHASKESIERLLSERDEARRNLCGYKAQASSADERYWAVEDYGKDWADINFPPAKKM